MLQEFFDKANITGYDKFVTMAVNMQNIIKAVKEAPDDKTIILIFHEEKFEKENKYKVKLIGRVLDDKYNPLAFATVVLFTQVTFDKTGNPNYEFVTNASINSEGIFIPAKSPKGMFEQTIPNDLTLVIKEMNNYYNEDNKN